jgi:hypothetical protein
VAHSFGVAVRNIICDGILSLGEDEVTGSAVYLGFDPIVFGTINVLIATLISASSLPVSTDLA